MKKTFSVPKINCGHCVSAIKNELTEIKGISKVEGDAAKKNITVYWDEPVNEEIIRKTLKDINYPAE